MTAGAFYLPFFLLISFFIELVLTNRALIFHWQFRYTCDCTNTEMTGANCDVPRKSVESTVIIAVLVTVAVIVLAVYVVHRARR